MLEVHVKPAPVSWPGRTVAAGFQAKLPTPFAVLGIRTSAGRLTDIAYLPRGIAALAPLDALAAETCRQIERYLDDPEHRFDLPLAIAGTPFQRRVWEEIAAIPHGQTRTYGDIARHIARCSRRRLWGQSPATHHSMPPRDCRRWRARRFHACARRSTTRDQALAIAA